jgi:hypothetical protein
MCHPRIRLRFSVATVELDCRPALGGGGRSGLLLETLSLEITKGTPVKLVKAKGK